MEEDKNKKVKRNNTKRTNNTSRKVNANKKNNYKKNNYHKNNSNNKKNYYKKNNVKKNNAKKNINKQVVKKINSKEIEESSKKLEALLKEEIVKPEETKEVEKKEIKESIPVKKKNNPELLDDRRKKRATSSRAKKVKIEEKKEIIEQPLKETIEEKKDNRNKNRLIIYLVLLTILLGLMLALAIKNYSVNQKENKEKNIEIEHQQLVLTIKEHYNKNVKVNKDASIYYFENETYIPYGTIYKDTELVLEDIDIDYLTKYFYSKEIDAYIKYEDVTPINEVKTYDYRYKKYIPFNENVVTNDNFSFYDGDNKIYTFNKSMSLPIIIKNYEDRYYVEYNNRLLSIKKDDVKEIVKSNNTTLKNASKITTLCYHRVYDTDEKCNDFYICKKKSVFDKEMKYLKDNGFFSLTMQEMYWYLKGNIQVPRKSITITLDDGWLIKSAIAVLEKYELNATSFVKTKSFPDLSGFKSDYLEVHSHTHNMHTNGVCRRERASQQGGGILCLPEKQVLEDLTTSRELLNGAIAMAYPFYDYNDRAMRLVKEAGFKLAFVGADGVAGRSYPGINTYKIPRMTMWDNTSFDKFKGYVNN